MNAFFKSFKLSKNDCIFILLISVLAVVVYANASSAYSGADLPFTKPLEKFSKIISGPVASVIGLVGIVALAAGLMFGGEMGEFLKRSLYALCAACFIVCASQFLDFAGNGNTLPDDLSASSLQALTAMSQL